MAGGWRDGRRGCMRRACAAGHPSHPTGCQPPDSASPVLRFRCLSAGGWSWGSPARPLQWGTTTLADALHAAAHQPYHFSSVCATAAHPRDRLPPVGGANGRSSHSGREDREGGPQIGRFIVTNSIGDRLTRAGEYPRPVPPDGFDTRLRVDTWWSRRLRAAIVKAHGLRPRGWPTPFPRGRPSSAAAGRRAISAHVTGGRRLCWVDRRASTEASHPYPLSAGAPTLLVAPRRSAAPGVAGPPPHRSAESSPLKSAAADGPGGAPHRGDGRPAAAAPRGPCASACQQSGTAAVWVGGRTAHPANGRIGADGGERQRKVPATGGGNFSPSVTWCHPTAPTAAPRRVHPQCRCGRVQVGAGVEGREPTETLLVHHPFCAPSAFCQRARPGCFVAGGSWRSRCVIPQRAVGSAAIGRCRSLSRPRQPLTPRSGGPVARLASSQGGVGWQQRWGQWWHSHTVLSRSWPAVRSQTSFLRSLLAPKPDAGGFQRVEAGE